MRLALAFTSLITATTPLPIAAQDVQILDGRAQVEFSVNGRDFVITRSQDTSATLIGEFARTSRPCPEFCIQPMIASVGVTPIAELELLNFLETEVASGAGLLLDARLPDWYANGHVPGAVNVPFAALDAQNPYQADILEALGALKTDAGLDFPEASILVIYDNGAWDDQATRTITDLITAGYPTSKILNYRGGMEDWLHLGLSTLLP
ncbi:rhodanese-like domain-containing protein [Yoonia sp. MH D7]